MRIIFFGLWICLVPTGAALAQPDPDESLDAIIEGFEEEQAIEDEPSLEEVVSGFDEPEDTLPSDTTPGKDKQRVTIDGTAKLGLTWNTAHLPPQNGETDWRGLSRLRPEILMETQIKPHDGWRLVIEGKAFYDAAYAIRGQDRFTDEVLDEYQQESEWREVFIQGRLNRYLDIKVGRQIVVWGRSDNIRITDVLNPLDLREPGLTDIEDLRLPVTMTRLDAYRGSWNLSAIALHEIRFNKEPVWGSDFFPAEGPLPNEVKPTDGGADTEWALALNGTFSGKDISFYWAELFDDQWHIALSPTGALQRRHARITMYGAAANLALGNWLIKTEAAYLDGLKFFNSGEQTAERLDGLVGFEYSGWDETTVSWELAVRHLVDFDADWASAPDFAQEDEIIQALRISRDFVDDTVNLTLLALVYGALGQDGALERLEVSYDWTDAITLKAGLVLYHAGDKYTLKQIDDNDRVFAEIAYRF